MKCVSCKSEMRAGREEFSEVIGQNKFVQVVSVHRCVKQGCAELYYEGKDLLDMERREVAWIAEHGVTCGAELRLLRKYMRLRAKDLAELLGVTPETVSHWETGKHEPDVSACQLVGTMMLEQIDGRSDTRDALAKRAMAPKRERGSLRRIELST